MLGGGVIQRAYRLCDLAYLMYPWYAPGIFLDAAGEKSVVPEGLPSEAEYLALYCKNRRIPIVSTQEWNYWKALNFFRKAAIIHGVYARGLQGNAGSTNAGKLAYIFCLNLRSTVTRQHVT